MIWRGHPTFEPRRSLVDDDVLRAAERHAARTAIIDARSGRTLTFGQLVDGACRVAAGLAERGIGHRDVVAIVAGNGPDYAVALYGALAAGAVGREREPGADGARADATTSASAHPKLVFTDEQSDAAVREAFRGDLDPARPARRRCSRRRGRGPPDGCRTIPRWLFPSSGTTGLPKLALHTHASTTAFLDAFAHRRSGALEPTDVVAARGAVPAPVRLGDPRPTRSSAAPRVVTLPTFDLEEFLRALQDYAATVVPATPPLVAALAAAPARSTGSTCRRCGS